MIWAGVRCQWVRARGIDGARNRSRSTDQLVGRWLARVNRNDDVAGEPTTDALAVRKPAGTVPATYRSLYLPPPLYNTHTHTHTHTWEKAEHARPRTHGGERATTTSAVKYPCGRLQAGLMELIKMCSINRTAGPPLTIRLACSPSYRLYLSTVHPPAPPPCPLVADPRTSGAQSNICV